MFIPFYKNKNLKEGDVIISLKEIKMNYGVFTPYHEFTILHIKNPYEISNIIIDNENNIEVEICDFNDFIFKTDIKTAQNRNTEILNNILFISFISQNCKHKQSRYEDYERYVACDLKKRNNDSCSVCNECIVNIDNDIIKKNKFITTYLRIKKIKKIKNGL